MIEIVNIDNEKDIMDIQVIYNDIIKQKKELKKEMITNPYKILYSFKDNNSILGRERHIASSLMNEVISFGKDNNISNITLEVRIDNIPAINLYKKYDFIECATRKGYYNGIDGILMKKEMI